MPRVKRSRTVAAEPDAVWELVSDPHHLPRWWPQVQRVEEVTGDAWTNVLRTPKGKTVRADYTRVEWRPRTKIVWRQEVEESPFEAILDEATTEIEIEPAGDGSAARVEMSPTRSCTAATGSAASCCAGRPSASSTRRSTASSARWARERGRGACAGTAGASGPTRTSPRPACDAERGARADRPPHAVGAVRRGRPAAVAAAGRGARRARAASSAPSTWTTHARPASAARPAARTPT